MQALYQSLVAVEPFTLIVTILNLFLQLYLIKKFFLNKILAVLDKRRELEERKLTDALSARAEAEKMKTAYEDKLQQADAQAEQILENAHKSAEAQSQALIAQTKQEISRLRQQAEADAEQQTRKAMNEAKNQISVVAISMAEQLLQRQLAQQDQDRLIRDFIHELEDRT